jgi:hypothetical protein
MKQDYCKVLEVHCLQALSYNKPSKTQNKNITNDEFEDNFADVNISIDDADISFDDIKFDIPTIEFDDMPKIIDNSNYIKGANKKNEDTNLIKTQIIKPMFLYIQKEGITKGRKYNVSEISRKIINQFNTKSQESLMQEYNFNDIITLKKAIQYNNDKAGGEIDNWCYKINKKEF